MKEEGAITVQGPWMIAFIVQWVIVLVLMLLVVGVLRHLGNLEEQWRLATPPISSYEIGQSISEFELPDAVGTMIRGSNLLAGSEGAILLFVTSTCSACVSLLTQISGLISSQHVAFGKSLVVIGEGGVGTVERLLEAHPELRSTQVMLLADDEGSVLRQFGITSVPTALDVDGNGRVIDQSLNPHAEKWLYKKLGVVPPADLSSGGWVSIVQRVPVRTRG
jgi:peroxiredoxin